MRESEVRLWANQSPKPGKGKGHKPLDRSGSVLVRKTPASRGLERKDHPSDLLIMVRGKSKRGGDKARNGGEGRGSFWRQAQGL